MAEIIEIGDVDFQKLGERVKAGEVFIYPTDTVYGIGCDVFNEEAVKRVFEIKGRAGDKPLSVAFHDVDQLLRYVNVDAGQEARIREVLPGAYTFIVQNQSIPGYVTAGLPTVGARVPDYGPILELIREADTPIVTTSANISGMAPACTLHDIPFNIVEKVDFVIDAGKCGSGKPSTIINLLDNKILR